MPRTETGGPRAAERAGSLHYTATGKFTRHASRQAGTGRLGEIPKQSQLASKRNSSRFQLAGATNFTGSQQGNRSMLEPRWRPVQVKL